MKPSALRLLLPPLLVFLPGVHGAEVPAPVLLKDIAPGQYSSMSGYYSQPVTMGDQLIFSATDLTLGRELWRTDGTADGTKMLKDIWSGSGWGNPEHFTTAGGLVYFTSQDATHGVELWRSDGTTAGTFMVKDLIPGPGSPYPEPRGAAGNLLFFTANQEGTKGGQLWKSDGTEAGTALVTTIYPSHTSSVWIYPVGTVGNIFYFRAGAPAGVELWRSDGTSAGTSLVTNMQPATVSPYSPSTAVAGNLVFYAPDDGIHGKELWRSDGTPAGSYLVKDIAPGSFSGVSAGLQAGGGLVFFPARTGPDAGWALWRSDGSAAGTFPLLDMADASAGTLHFLGNSAYFVHTLSSGKKELWKTDGTVAGTISLQADTMGEDGRFIAAGDKFYFYTSKSQDLWQSDGTVSGTRCVGKLLAPGVSSAAGGTNFEPVFLNGKIYRAGYSNLLGIEPYAFDTTRPSIARPVASEVTGNSMKLNTGVNPNGFATTAKLRFGPTEAYGITLDLPMGAGNADSSFHNFSLPFGDLLPGTRYYYEVTATSVKGMRVFTGTLSTPYSQGLWRSTHFGISSNSGAAADTEDPEHDGMNNLIEYAFGLNPSASDPAGLPQGTRSGGYITIAFTQPPGISDVVYGAEWSRTLAEGSWQAIADEGEEDFHVFRSPDTGSTYPRLFMRLTVRPK